MKQYLKENKIQLQFPKIGQRIIRSVICMNRFLYGNRLYWRNIGETKSFGRISDTMMRPKEYESSGSMSCHIHFVLHL